MNRKIYSSSLLLCLIAVILFSTAGCDKDKEKSGDLHTLTLVSDPTDGGTLTGEGEYEESQEIEISAEQGEGFEFVEWRNQEEVVSHLPDFIYTMPAENTELTAIFKEPGDDKKECLISNLDVAFELTCGDSLDITSEKIEFGYDTEGRLIRWDWVDGDSTLFIYDDDGNLLKIEEYYSGSLEYLLLTRDDNRITLQWYFSENDIHVPDNSKDIIEVGENNEITMIENYDIDGDQWIMSGYQQYTWNNGNLAMIEEYYKESLKKSYLSANPGSFANSFSRRESALHKGKFKNLDTKEVSEEFDLVSTVSMIYDNKHNPFTASNIPSVYDLGSQFFNSVNNIISYNKTWKLDGKEYVTTVTYNWEYNDYKYPSLLILAEGETEGEEEDVICSWRETMTFSYLNCE
jgi:YD repeat-containing protein